MHVLITGGAGFIGSHLARRLLERGDTVAVLDNLSTGSFENIRALTANPRFSFAIDDLGNALVLDRLASQADAIVHLAAAVGVQLVVERPTETIETNVLGTHAVLNAAALSLPHADCLHQRSLRQGRQDPLQRRGRPPARPVQSQPLVLRGEQAAGRVPRPRRLPRVPATRDRHALLQHRRPRPNRPLRHGRAALVRQALEEQPITVFGDGKQSRCFCHVDDTAIAVQALLDLPGETAGEIYNIGSREEVTINQLAQAVLAQTGSRSSIQRIPYSEAYAPGFEDMRRRVPDTGKLHAAVGWQPRKTLADILDDVIRYERSRVA